LGEGFRNILYRSCSQFSTCFIRREGTRKISSIISFKVSKYPKISTCTLGPCCHVLEKLRHGAQFCNQMLLTAKLEQEVGEDVGLDEGILGYKTKSTYALSSYN